jgi:uncharacterized protein YidB (DUF937 family)
MDFKPLAVRVLIDRLDCAQNSGKAELALDKLAINKNGFDLQSLVSEFDRAGGESLRKVRSWLGDGANETISRSQIQQVLGNRRLDAFAAVLGMSRESATQRLCEILPELVNKASQGGRLLGSNNEQSGLARLASRLLKRVA